MNSGEADDSKVELESAADDGRFLHKISDFLDTELNLISKFTATINIWLSLVLLVATSVIYVTAFATVYWAETSQQDIGLWLVCDEQSGCVTLVSDAVTSKPHSFNTSLSSPFCASIFTYFRRSMSYRRTHSVSGVGVLRSRFSFRFRPFLRALLRIRAPAGSARRSSADVCVTSLQW